MIERQVIVTWYTPEEKLPPEDWYCVVSFSADDGNCHYDHALGIGVYWDDGHGWYVEGLSDKAEFTVHAWADLDPFGGNHDS